MQHIDVFEMLEKQNCNVLVCSFVSEGGEAPGREVKTPCEIARHVRVQAGEEAFFRLEWRYPLLRFVTAQCRLDKVEVDETQISLRDVIVQFRQADVDHGHACLDELKLSAAELRRPLAHVHQTSAPA